MQHMERNMNQSKVTKKKQMPLANETDEPLMDEYQLAERSGLTVSFIRKAKDKYGLTHHQIGRLIRYKWSDYQAWLSQRRVTK